MKKRLKADVVASTGNTTHAVGKLVDGKPMIDEQIPVPAWVEIAEDDGGFFLMHYDEEGTCIADTWHQSLDEAKEQAEFEFGISASGWRTS